MKRTLTTTDEEVGERERAALALWAELSGATGTLRAGLEEELGKALGILPEEAELLVALSEAPEQRLRMVDVATALHLSRSGATRLVDRLAGRELVLRAACPNDRRVVYAGLTEDGRRLAAAAAPAFAAGVARQIPGRLVAQDLDALTTSLRGLLTADTDDG